MIRSATMVLAELSRSIKGGTRAATRSPPHVRSRSSTDRLLLRFVVASAPALAMGCWNLGAQLISRIDTDSIDVLASWRRPLVPALDASTDAGAVSAFALGLSYLLPLLFTALAVAVVWEVVFATLRRRSTDPGWLMTAWVFTALLPASMPLPAAALGLSFGLVFGSHIFGGTGRYLLSPALLGVVFLNISYPGLFAGDRWLPGLMVDPTWALLAADGIDTLLGSGLTWWSVFVGREIAALGSPSALACSVGAAFLVVSRAASWRTIAGGVLGMVIVSALFNHLGSEDPAAQIPWHWHLATGSFAFGLAFIATDPTTMPLTAIGRWLYGGFVGGLVVVVRVANPEHPEGTLFALVIGALFAPLVDHVVVAARIRAFWRGGLL